MSQAAGASDAPAPVEAEEGVVSSVSSTRPGTAMIWRGGAARPRRSTEHEVRWLGVGV